MFLLSYRKYLKIKTSIEIIITDDSVFYIDTLSSV